MNILIVDSDPIQIQSLARGLKGRGHSVVSATNGEAAFAALDGLGGDIQLLLADLKVPHLDVFELARKARIKNELFPVIIMTTYINSELQGRVRSESNLALLQKPFDLEKLLQMVERFALSHDTISRPL